MSAKAWLYHRFVRADCISTQYHAALILLHRPFVQYESQDPSSETGPGDCDSKSRFTNHSRTVCADSAGCIVEVFERYRTRLDLSRVYGTGLAHAGSAATALMGEAILQTDKAQLETVVAQLCSLRQTISQMAVAFPPAKFMASIVDGYISGIGSQRGGEPPPDTDILMDQGGSATPVLPNVMASRNSGHSGSEAHRVRDPTQNPYSFTPTEAASHSIKGLPFLPSSFLEGFSTHDLLPSEQMGYSDYGFSWEADPGSV